MPGDSARQPVPMPPEAFGRADLAALMRPAVPALVDWIVREVWRAVPVYARPGSYGRVTRHGVECAVALFVDLVEDPLAPRDRLYETCRRLGAGEAREGRTLDDLQAAYRAGTRAGWRWIMRLGRRHRLSSAVMARLAEMLFGYADELARMSIRGYREAQAEPDGARPALRRRLLRLMTGPVAVTDSVLAELAAAAGWVVPREVAAVALEPPVTPAWGPEVLADVEPPHPYLLVPAPVEAGTHFGGRAAVGPPVPPAAAAHSLRWARTSLRLVAQGVLPDVPVTWCAEHLTTLWLLCDVPLADQVARHELAPLAQFPDRTRRRLGETLLSWLENGGNSEKIAVDLSVHPQTVRYRVRQLKQAFGERLENPEARFAMQAALRASALRSRGA
ncbi:helix-turn-helix domain-containing protein [Amycolatopsis australiensis]|uniref:PucR C-terminal helix-turn-helix domain-containing protein n=1 Tax=Amycolatopsis australiensis TaxID=546364 RepID=A0A1K1SMC9_9PSEU|nr:helix-turn-helix domain-containing protein [Amycolatopsis australiensis]SFW85021.1 PucR C-terminal helix-turn-helix domain-containing protein [Amycolatopsis australiensis]